MLATRTQLDDFHAYATEQLANGGADLTLEQLLWKWQEFNETGEGVRRGLEERAEGGGMPLHEFAERMRDEHHFSQEGSGRQP